jgi:ABC-2 type transport system ATP-binding protein
MNNPEPVITINDLCLRFGKKKVLDGVNARFERGEAVLVAGNNGAGKSTLLRCIAGIYHPGSGSIRLAPSIDRNKLGLISDKMSLFEHFILKEGIEFHSRVFNIKKFDDSLIKPLNIDMNQKIKNLSAGERALYHLSLVLSQEPDILLVDEIIHAIDPYLRELFLEGVIELIDRLQTTVIMVNQVFYEMGRIPERVLIMENGRFVLDEKTEDLFGKMKKIVTDKEISPDIPVIFKKVSSMYTEYYVYPFSEEMKTTHDCEFRGVDLTEIVKSFIGGYYAKKRG